jgi:hypothetical protein
VTPLYQRQPEPQPARERRLLAVGAWWNDDQPDGLRLMVDFVQKPDEGRSLYEQVQANCRSWDQYPEPRIYLNQLQTLALKARTPESLDAFEVMLVIVNIAWLESRGHLKADEFNGIQWLWVL